MSRDTLGWCTVYCTFLEFLFGGFFSGQQGLDEGGGERERGDDGGEREKEEEEGGDTRHLKLKASRFLEHKKCLKMRKGCAFWGRPGVSAGVSSSP